MVRQIVKIDEEKCDGCGACAKACHEGAIALVDGKAKLLRDDYCDGLGNCLPVCHAGAITFETREAAAYDEAAVLENLANTKNASRHKQECGCPGAQPRILCPAAEKKHDKHKDKKHKHKHDKHECGCPGSSLRLLGRVEAEASGVGSAAMPSQLRHWPVQIKLVPPHAPYFDGAHLLVAADCCAFAYGNFHNDFLRNRVVLVGCPKLDDIDYTEKLTAIIAGNSVKSLTITRMEVPCCGGLEHAAVAALKASGKFIPWQVFTISVDGKILDS